MRGSRFLPDVRPAIEGLLEVLTKDGEWVPFRLNFVQAKLAEKRKARTIILKARQMGVTTYVMAENICTCLALENVRCAMIAHDRDHTVRLMRRLRLMVERLKESLARRGVKLKVRRESDYEIEFADTRSTIFIGTAGSKNFGRSDTIHRLHCSEVAFWPRPDQLVSGLLQAVPKEGVVYYESTANGLNYFYKLWQAAQDTGWPVPLFFPWKDFQEYRLKPPRNFVPLPDEAELMERFGLDLEQIYWRREKIASEFGGKEELFRQEYPLTPEEAFIASGRPVFPSVDLVTGTFTSFAKQAGWEKFLVAGDHPRSGWEYTLGVDPAGGTGGDFSAVVGVGLGPEGQVELVLVARDRFIRPRDLGTHLKELGLRWNKALIVVERNSIGLAVLDQLLAEGYPEHRIWREFIKRRDKFGKTIRALEYGVYTGRKKGLIISAGQALLDALGGGVWDADLQRELQEYTETAPGKYEGLGEHDDLAMAFCLCGFGAKYLRPRIGTGVEVVRDERPRVTKDFVFEVRFEDIFKRAYRATPWIFLGEG